MRQRRYGDRFDDIRPKLAHRLATDDLGDFGDYWVACNGLLAGGHVQEVRGCGSYQLLRPRFCSPSRCRHYFLKHLADVVNSNAKRKHEVDDSEKGIQPTDHEHRSGEMAGVIKRPKPRSTYTARTVEEGYEEPQSTPSSDWTSGMSRRSSATYALGQYRVPDLKPASGMSGTLGRQTPIPQISNHPKQPSLLSEVVRKLFPKLHRKLWRTVTEPRTSTLVPGDPGCAPQSSHDGTTVVPYLTFPTTVGKNSTFHDLTQEQLEELGGIEFRALNMLMWAVPLVCRIYFLRDA